jgi:hypothetical protein
MLRRGFLIGCALLLAGCAQPKLTGDASADLSIAQVTVTTASSEEAVSGRPNDVTKEKLEADLKALLTSKVVGRPGTLKADLVVDVREVNLIPRGVSALVPAQSTSKAVISVTEAKTGKVLVPPTEITALSARLRAGGIIGVATAPSVENDYIAVLNGLANAVEKRLYGTEN